MSIAMMVIFWLSAAAITYAWFGYAVLLAVLASLRGRSVKRAPSDLSVSFIVPVHNGGDAILRKLDNLRSVDYPRDLVEIIVVDDCSTDGTVSLIKDCAFVRLIRLAERQGKAAALNAGLEIASGDVIGFTDVGAMSARDATSVAMERFADPYVGCVSSEDDIVSDGGVAGGESLYTKIDTLIRRLEGSVCSSTGMSGSFYFVRRELCPLFPLDVATDMFSALHCVDSGYRAVVEERSRVAIIAQRDMSREFERKVRTMVTGLRALSEYTRLLSPCRTGLFSVFLVSHKLLRYLTPLFVILIFASGWLLGEDSLFYCWTVRAIVIAMSIGLGHILIQKSTHASDVGLLGRILGVCAFACMSTAAALVGWYRFLSGERFETWKPTERSAA